MIRVCTWEDASRFVEEARLEGVALRDWRRTVWVTVDGAAIAAVRQLRGDWWRLCACYVRPSRRGQGLGRQLVMWRLAYARAQGARRIDVFSYRPTLFPLLGFRVVDEYPTVGTSRCVWTA